MNTAQAETQAPLSVGRTVGRVRVWLSAAVAAVLGLLPHVLHHAGPLAGAALLGGVGGSLLFGAAGFLLSIPFLLRVRRHCGNWRVPGALLAAFAIVFSISTFVVGPSISGTDESPRQRQEAPARGGQDGSAHEAHH